MKMKISKGKIYKPKKSKYLYMDLSVNGQRLQRSLNTDDEKEAKEILEDIKVGFLKGEITLKKEETQQNTFGYYSKVYLEMLSVKPQTYRNREYIVNILNKEFKDQDISSIKPSDLKRFLKPYNRDRHISIKTVLKGIFQEALDDEAIVKNPCDNIKSPRLLTDEDIHPFSIAEVNQILSKADGWFKCFLAVGFYSGLRTGEIIALRWQNIDFNKKRIFVNASRSDFGVGSTKTNSSRYVPLFESLIPFLLEQRKITGLREFVFLTNDGNIPYAQNIRNRMWKPLLRRLNIPHRSLYTTRHTFATTLLNSKKFSLNQIAMILGHKNIQMLIKNYNKFIEDEIGQIDTKIDVFCENFCDTISGKAC